MRASLIFSLCVFALSGCGGGGGSGGSDSGGGPGPGGQNPAAFTIGGTVSGLSGTGLVLQNTAGADLTIGANGSFTFPGSVTSGTLYSISIKAQPANPAQACTIANATGTVAAANITNVTVTCPAPPPAQPSGFSIGGTVSGLSGTGLVLRNNGGDPLPVAANGAFAFTNRVGGGTAFGVTVGTQPTNPNQICNVTNGTGTATADVTNIVVSCVNAFRVGGTIAGAQGSGLVISFLPGGVGQIPMTPAYNGPFWLYFPVNTQYEVRVVTQPTNPAQVCHVGNGSGTLTSDISNVVIICAAQTHPIGGTVSGLTGSGLVLRETASATTLNVAADGAFTMPSLYTSGVTFDLVVSSQPTNPAQTCSVINGSGVTADAPVTSIEVVCRDTPAPGRFVYVLNNFGSTVSGYRVDPSAGALTSTGSAISVPANPHHLLASADRRFLYVRSGSSSGIGAFAIDQTTGALSAIAGSPFNAGSSASRMTMHPSGRFLYVPNAAGQSIAAFLIDQTTGALSPIGSPVAVGFAPGQLAITPDGRFAYVANGTSNALAGFAIDDASGVLTALSSNPFTQLLAGAPTIDPLARFLYGPTSANTVYGKTIDSVTGALGTIQSSPFPTGSGPGSVAIDPLGRFAFVANSSESTVSAYRIDGSTGALIAANVREVGTLVQSVLTVRADSRVVYAANLVSDDVDALVVNSSTGVLTPAPGNPFATGGGPNPVVLDPGGKWAYVSNAVSNNVWVYAVDTITGALTPVSGSPFAAGNGPIDLVVVQ